uniref:Putative secreted protein n=1 Tax=Corethrella appendiculata TaxID=1370023 RepID=U5ENJ6_9DIPT
MKVFVIILSGFLLNVHAVFEDEASIAFQADIAKSFVGKIQYYAMNQLIEFTFKKIFDIKETQSEVENLHRITMERFDEILNQIEQSASVTIDQVKSVIELYSYMSPTMKEIEEFISALKIAETAMVEIVRDKDKKLENITIINFAESLFSHDQFSISSRARIIYRELLLSTKVSRESFFNRFLESIHRKTKMKTCGNIELNYALDFFRFIFTAELSVYRLQMFGFVIYNFYNFGSFSAEREIVEQQFANRINGYGEIFQLISQHLSVTYYRCDERNHEKGITYQELSRFILGIIEWEADLIYYCYPQKCEYFAKNHYRKEFRFNGPVGSFRACNGRLHGCRWQGDTYNYCVNQNKSESKFYSYISSEYIQHGRKEDCGNLSDELTTNKNHWRHCDYCFCECESNASYVHKHLSLREEVSDIAQNKVIVGVRFRKIGNRVIGLQIQEGRLLNESVVNTTMIDWKHQQAFKMDANDRLENDPQLYEFNYDQRLMTMKVLNAPNGTVITGVKFVLTENNIPDLSIRCTKYDRKAGKLDLSDEGTQWLEEYHRPSHDTYDAFEKQVPTNCDQESQFLTLSGDTIKFASSDWGTDGGQSTLPFFDIRDVVPNVLTGVTLPLASVGILLKGCLGSGGFITPIVSVNAHYFIKK